jgi:hypothetical protein
MPPALLRFRPNLHIFNEMAHELFSTTGRFNRNMHLVYPVIKLLRCWWTSSDAAPIGQAFFLAIVIAWLTKIGVINGL